jgi:hypothetical protein
LVLEYSSKTKNHYTELKTSLDVFKSKQGVRGLFFSKTVFVMDRRLMMQEKEEPLRHFGIPKKCHECEGLTKDGKQCKRPASCHLQCQHYCWQHASLHVKGKQCHDLPGPPDILFHQLHPYNKIPGQPERDVYITDEEWKEPVLEGNCAYWAVCQLFNARFMSIENFFRWMRDESPWYKEHPEVRRPVVGDGLRPEAINEFLQSHMRVKVGNKMMHLSVTDLAAPIVVNAITARQRQYFHAYLNSVTNDYDGPPGILLRGMAFFNRQTGQYRKNPPPTPRPPNLESEGHIVCLKRINGDWMVYDSNSRDNHPMLASFQNTIQEYHYVVIWIALVRYIV